MIMGNNRVDNQKLILIKTLYVIKQTFKINGMSYGSYKQTVEKLYRE